MIFQFEEEFTGQAQIRVVGVGGAGGNAVNGMVTSGLQGVEFVSVNTDAQALRENLAGTKVQIGGMVTRGLGSGGDPRVGAKAIEEDHATVAEVLTGADMVFVTGGMGGGTGTGAAPTVARIARELGALVVGIVTLPFSFEGRRRGSQAYEGMEELKREVDTLIAIPNERLLKVVPANTPLTDAFRVADQVLYQATKGISDLITVPGLVNLDFADVRSIMAGMGDAIMGTGMAKGDGRAVEAAHAAISSPLLEDVDVRGAQGVLVNITGGTDLTLHEVSEVTGLVQDAVGADANLIFGAVIDPTAGEEIRVTVIATGFGSAQSDLAQPEHRAAAAAAPAPVLQTRVAPSEPVRPEMAPNRVVYPETAPSVRPAANPDVREIPIRPAPVAPAASRVDPVAPPTPASPAEELRFMEARGGESASAHSPTSGAEAQPPAPQAPAPVQPETAQEPTTIRPLVRRPTSIFDTDAREAGRSRLLHEEQDADAPDPEAPGAFSGQGRDAQQMPTREELDKPAFLRRTMD